MSDIKVNSVQPSEVGPSMVAYLLTVAILAKDYDKQIIPFTSIPVPVGYSEEEILRAFAEASKTVSNPHNVEKFLKGE